MAPEGEGNPHPQWCPAGQIADGVGIDLQLLAHEVLHPLATILALAETCSSELRRAGGEPQLTERLKVISQQAERASALLRAAAAAQRPAPVRRVEVDLRRVIRSAAKGLERAAVARAPSLRVRIPARPLLAWGDPRGLGQVLENLLRNALESMSGLEPAERQVELGAKQLRGELLVWVRDRGSGIDRAVRDRLFDAFATTKEPGRGLGLAVCRRIVEAHGGRLWATPNETRGTTFWVSLPQSPSLRAPRA